MAEGMPYFKPHKTPVESSEESLEDIEKQASLLFEEFLRLPQAANTRFYSKRAELEDSDSPISREEKKFGQAVEDDEGMQDDMVTDCDILVKSSVPSPPAPQAVRPPQDPTITKLALQMQQAGDALHERFEGRVDGAQSHLVSYILNNAAGLTYEQLSKEIDNMVGRDRNWTNFAMAMYLGKRVCLETSNACSAVKGYFQRYVSQSYSHAMQQAGGMAPFVKSKGH